MRKYNAIHYRNTYYFILLLISDTLSYILSLSSVFFSIQVIEKYVEYNFAIENTVSSLILVFIFYVSFIILLGMQGLYSSRKPFWKEFRNISISVILFSLFLVSVFYFDKTGYISRLFILLIFIYLLLFTISFRFLIKNKILAKGFLRNNAIIIGNFNEVESKAIKFEKEKSLGFNIIGIITIDRSESRKFKNYDILGSINRINDILKTYNVNSCIFLPSALKYQGISSIINILQLQLYEIIIVPEYKGMPFSNAEIMQTLETELSYVQIKNNLKSLLNRFIKRTIDLILSITLLPFVLLVVLIIGVIIKITSKGPIFYTQKRIGRYGKIINILKFRSMYIDADERLKNILKDKTKAKEWEKTHKLKDDPRITFIGKFLRKTSLDELPQIFNVLKGDMSLVGPRPVVEYELEKYYKDYSSYYLMVRPGITGLWQISGRSNTSYEFRVAKDTWYVLNWSLWLDIIIMLKTPIVVFRQEGAY